MVSRLVLVLGDQLSEGLSALRAADPERDVVVMAEVAEEAGYVAHHPKKIALIFAAMRKFAARLRDAGWELRYTALDDTENSGSIPGELLRRAEELGASEVIATQPGEFRLIAALDEMGLKVTQLTDDRFLTDLDWFEDWARGRKSLRMEYFYREMRKSTGYLMEEGKPAGGQWNFDHDNRKPAPGEIAASGPMRFTPDETVEEVLDLVERRFGNSFGETRPFWFATDQGEARRALTHFVKTALPRFGDYQDAMMGEERFLYHGVISGYMNIGLLDPREVCDAVEAAWRAGDVPINAAEGFIRQVIGWREYMRAIYFREGPEYPRRNWLNHQRGLPPLYWGAETRMRCLAKAVEQTREEAYAHHIQRLMVTGNFALLAGIDPAEVEEWYMRVYFDAFEWVTAPNTVGMSQFADGGVIASKPYVSSGSYIDRMSDYCGDCAYSVKTKTGEGACPFNLLYWHFMDRHRERFAKNPRMAQMYATWDRMGAEKQETIRNEAEDFLRRLSDGEVV
nr:cryptochrome/photolyase family protein [Roseivivax sp. GX 12232]